MRACFFIDAAWTSSPLRSSKRSSLKHSSPLLLALAGSILALSAHAQMKDSPGGKDHEIVGRFQGSVLIDYGRQNHEQISVPLGAVEYGKDGNVAKEKLEAQGKLSHYTYYAPAERTSLEVFRNYEQALKDKGFRIVYACAKPEECQRLRLQTYASYWTDKAGTFHGGSNSMARMSDNGNYPPRYLVAERKRAEGDVVVVLHVTDPTSTQLDRKMGSPYYLQVLEAQKMQMGAVVVDAKAITGQLVQEGRVAFYGINFDTGSASLQAASQAQIAQMAQSLKAQPQARVFVVGHTDNVGGYAQNQGLSQRRAQAVVDAMALQGIDKGRMQAVGVANVSPLASNAGDDGRARNRRVELVLQ